MTDPDFSANLERFTGFGPYYDRVRPAPSGRRIDEVQLRSG
jgi:hypothetical protein